MDPHPESHNLGQKYAELFQERENNPITIIIVIVENKDISFPEDLSRNSLIFVFDLSHLSPNFENLK